MIKFFRQFRQNMINDPSETRSEADPSKHTVSSRAGNRFSRYMLYALGEIVLVVVGILIAVSINEWNNDKKQKAEIDQLVKGFQDDLKTNIKDASNSLNFVVSRNENIMKIMKGEITRENYENKEIGPIVLSYSATKIVDENIKRILDKEDLLNQELSRLLPDLKSYHENIDFEPHFNTSFSDFTLAQNRYFVDELPWFSDYITSTSDEAIDYFLNDPIYMNKVVFYQILLVHNFGSTIANRRNLELSLLHKLDKIGRKKSNDSFEKTATDLNFTALTPLPCNEELKLDSTSVEHFLPLFINASPDTLKATLYFDTRKNHLEIPIVIPPFENQSLMGFGSYYIEVTHNEKCIEKYGSAKNGYLIYKDSTKKKAP